MWWCRARVLFRSQIPVTTGGFELQISCIRSRYLTDSLSTPPVVTGICNPNKSRARHHHNLKLGSRLKYLKINRKGTYFVRLRFKNRKAKLKQRVRVSLAKYVGMFRHDSSYNIRFIFTNTKPFIFRITKN